MDFLKKLFWLVIIVVLCWGIFAKCSSSAERELANEMSFELDGISDLSIAYGDGEIQVFEHQGSGLIIKEYMTVNKRRYYAKIKEGAGELHISEGGKPFFKGGFFRSVEVYLPAGYHQGLTLTTTSSTIDLSGVKPDISMLRIDTTSGTVRLPFVKASDLYLSTTSGILELGQINGEKIRLQTTSGKTQCLALNGHVSYVTTSGDLNVTEAAGAGQYRAENSGVLKVVYNEVKGDLSFFNKNGNVDITLPAELAFQFEAKTKNGTITTPFNKSLIGEAGGLKGPVGNAPAITVQAETKNGDIVVKK